MYKIKQLTIFNNNIQNNIEWWKAVFLGDAEDFLWAKLFVCAH